jgi:hypothetical protein
LLSTVWVFVHRWHGRKRYRKLARFDAPGCTWTSTLANWSA